MPRWQIYADFLVTKARAVAIRKAIAAGKAIYTEKPTAESFEESLELARLARRPASRTASCTTSSTCPACRSSSASIDSGFFGASSRCAASSATGCSRATGSPPSGRAGTTAREDGGGIVVDMFPHWNYVLENLFGRVESVYARTATHIPSRVDEHGDAYVATADDSAYAVFELEGGIVAQLNSSWAVRVNRDELVEFQVDGTHGSAVVGLFGAKVQPRVATPKPVWNPDLADTHDFDTDWVEVPTNDVFENGFKTQWEEFIRHVVEDAPNPYDFLAGARGVLLAELGLASSRDGRRIDPRS